MALKEVTIKLPQMLANDISAKEIVGIVMDKAVTMAEYYRSRCKEFEQKHLIPTSLKSGRLRRQ